jgi:hypothetical protein
MNRTLVILATLALLLAAAPASATDLESTASCDPDLEPFEQTAFFTSDVIDQNYEGSLCIKACKAHSGGCKKVSSTIRKCKQAMTKALQKSEALQCQLEGGDKKTCKDAAKATAKAVLGMWKTQFVTDKNTCAGALQLCQTACTP